MHVFVHGVVEAMSEPLKGIACLGKVVFVAEFSHGVNDPSSGSKLHGQNS